MASNIYFSKYIQLMPGYLYERTLNVIDFKFSWYFINDVDSSLGALPCEDAGNVGDILRGTCCLHLQGKFGPECDAIMCL
jgi:hypothetical protein